MKRRLNGLVRLARYKEYFFFVIVTTLLGAIAANGEFGWKMVGILVANWLAVAFAFMINDVEDAPDDALNPEKVNRNPVSCNDLSVRTATAASWVIAFFSLVVYAFVGFWPFVMGAICILLGFLYSWRGLGIRLKNKPVLDLASHCMMLAGLQFLGAYFTFNQTPFERWFPPFLFVTCISLYGELFNELRDLDGDVKAGLAHTAVYLGPEVTYWLMMSVFTVGVLACAYTFFIIQMIPFWIIGLMAILAVVLNIPSVIKARKSHSIMKAQEHFQKPFEIAAAIALLIQIVAPWAIPLMNQVMMATLKVKLF